MSIKAILLILIIAASVSFIGAQTTEFTYQGNLQNNGMPATGSYDLEFRLFDAVSGGSQVGTTITRANTAVANGVFSVILDFGSSAFPGANRFLEIRARTAGAPSYTVLDPRQKLTSSPFAIRTLAANAADSLSANCSLCITDAHIQAVGGNKLTDGTVTTTKLADGSVTEGKLSLELLNSSQRQRSLVGSLRWDLLKPQTDFTAGTSPQRVAFDGQNIWVTNQTSNNVTKLRASDGANLGTFAVGTAPVGIAFDGTNMWIMNSGSANLTRLRASDGFNLGNIAAVSGSDIVFDGTHMWVASFNGGMVGKYRASDGVNLGFFAAGNFPRGLAFDGSNIWITNVNDGIVRRLRTSDGSLVGSTINVGSQPNGMAYDGDHIWVANNVSNSLTKIRAADGTVVGTVVTPTAPLNVAYDGTHIWVACLGTVAKFRAADNALAGVFELANPRGLAFDGSNVWAATSTIVRRMGPAFP